MPYINFPDAAERGALTDEDIEEYLDSHGSENDRAYNLKYAIWRASWNKKNLPLVNKLLKAAETRNIDLTMRILVKTTTGPLLIELNVLPTDTIIEMAPKLKEAILQRRDRLNADPELKRSDTLNLDPDLVFTFSYKGEELKPGVRLIDRSISIESVIEAVRQKEPISKNTPIESKQSNQSSALFTKITHISLLDKIFTEFSQINPNISKDDIRNKWIFEASFLHYLGIKTQQDASCTFRSSNDELKLLSLPSADELSTLRAQDASSTKPSQYANSVRFKVKLTTADSATLKNNSFIAGIIPIADADSWYHVFVNKEKLYSSISQLVLNSEVKDYLINRWPRESGNDNKSICAIQ